MFQEPGRDVGFFYGREVFVSQCWGGLFHCFGVVPESWNISGFCSRNSRFVPETFLILFQMFQFVPAWQMSNWNRKKTL